MVFVNGGVAKHFRWPNLAGHCVVRLGMNLETESYQTQTSIWPDSGRIILANFDDDSIVVHYAYRPEIGHFVATAQRLRLDHTSKVR